MRLWHKDLIPVLPRQQLLSQWRECCCIARNIAVNGTPNHILVNEIMNYHLDHFVSYCVLVVNEMRRRDYKVDDIKAFKYIQYRRGPVDFYDLYMNWHNDRYLTQCYYNLQEKYDRGGITEEEWSKIAQMYNLRYTKKG